MLYKNYEYSDKMTLDNIKNLKIAQQKMTQMLAEFNKFCIKYNLTYWC